MIGDFSIDTVGNFLYRSGTFFSNNLVRGTIMAFSDINHTHSVKVSVCPFNPLYMSAYHGCIRDGKQIIYTEDEYVCN